MKKKLAIMELGLGRTAWVEVASYGAVLAKADLHYDDPIWTVAVGSPQQCWKAISSVARAVRNNRLGMINFGHHA